MSSGAEDVVVPPNQDPAAQGGHTPGALLQQERLRRGLSVQQAAEGLHLDPWIIEAMEANQFLALGAPVYAKGYLRKFAVLLGLAPDVVVARYEALTDTPVVPTPIPVITTTPPPRPKWPKVLGWCLLAVLIGVIGWIAFKLFMPKPVDSVAQVESVPAATTVATTSPAPAVVQSGTTTESVATESEPLPATTTQAALETSPSTTVIEPTPPAPATLSSVLPQPSASAPSTKLSLEFSEASWVEVYDANGQRLLYDVGSPNRARIVSGPAPLSVVVGIASAVTVEVDDREIVVPRRANKDSTRFVVAADGSVSLGSNR